MKSNKNHGQLRFLIVQFEAQPCSVVQVMFCCGDSKNLNRPVQYTHLPFNPNGHNQSDLADLC